MTRFSKEAYVDGVLQGDRRLLAKAVTLLESARADDARLAREVLEALLPHAGNSVRMGITGPPGVGKSTFIEALGLHLIDSGHRAAVLAVDPTSSRTGGSILGDKTRMQQLSARSEAFIRPSPAGDTLGGVARKTRETILICEAAGFDRILVETVGVGQSEIEVAGMVDFFALLALPNAGDELQGIKRGIMEMADAIFVNKADGPFLEAAEGAAQTLRLAMMMLHGGSQGWETPVTAMSAREGRGVEKVVEILADFRDAMEKNGEWSARRRRQSLDWMWEMVHEAQKREFLDHPQVRRLLPMMEGAVTSGEIPPAEAAARLLDLFYAREGESKNNA